MKRALTYLILFAALSLTASAQLSLTTATIAESASLSSGVNLRDSVVVGIIMPSSWTTADITLQASYDGTTYYDVYNMDGDEYTITASASRIIVLSPLEIQWARYIKIRSGTASTPVTQSAARSINLISRSVQ